MDRERMENICKLGQGKDCCRYLICGIKGFACAKNSDLAVKLDCLVETNKMIAQGNNCEGFSK